MVNCFIRYLLHPLDLGVSFYSVAIYIIFSVGVQMHKYTADRSQKKMYKYTTIEYDGEGPIEATVKIHFTDLMTNFIQDYL